MKQNFYCQLDFKRDSKECCVALGEMDTFTIQNDIAFLTQKGQKKILHGDPLKEFEKILKEKKSTTKNASLSQGALAIGFISYDAKSLVFPECKLKKTLNNFPQMWFAFPTKDNYLEKLNRTNENTFLSNPEIESIEDYSKKFKQIQDYLFEGDIYQANLTFPIEFDFEGDPYVFYEKMCHATQPGMGAYFDIGNYQILSFSPERFFKIKNGIIFTNPVKGTIARSKNPVVDIKRKRDLAASEKDRAEHIMIVDLLRNDVGKISKTNSIAVKNILGIKSHKTVHHLETEISGNLKTTSVAEIFRAMFPGGSITGAPKKRAIEIIDEVERYNRGIYTGAVGKIGFDGAMDFSVAIRTMMVNKDRATYPVGGGITVGSTVRGEYSEALLKAKIIMGENDVLGISKR